MGLIKEPMNVDFYVIDKTWSEKEREEFSAFIKQRKEQFNQVRKRKDAVKSKALSKQVVEQKKASLKASTNS